MSGAFALPGYQQQANVPVALIPQRFPLAPQSFQGRGVPDVTGAGDPATGYNILVDGQNVQEGGTSAVAPLWAALIALINQKLKGRVGFVNPQLYALPANSGAFHDITVGNNRVSYQDFDSVGYDAGPGWDACSGLGSPDGTKLAGLLQVGTPVATPALAPAGPRKPKKPARRTIGRAKVSSQTKRKLKVRARK